MTEDQTSVRIDVCAGCLGYRPLYESGRCGSCIASGITARHDTTRRAPIQMTPPPPLLRSATPRFTSTTPTPTLEAPTPAPRVATGSLMRRINAIRS